MSSERPWLRGSGEVGPLCQTPLLNPTSLSPLSQSNTRSSCGREAAGWDCPPNPAALSPSSQKRGSLLLLGQALGLTGKPPHPGSPWPGRSEEEPRTRLSTRKRSLGLGS